MFHPRKLLLTDNLNGIAFVCLCMNSLFDGGKCSTANRLSSPVLNTKMMVQSIVYSIMPVRIFTPYKRLWYSHS